MTVLASAGNGSHTTDHVAGSGALDRRNRAVGDELGSHTLQEVQCLVSVRLDEVLKLGQSVVVFNFGLVGSGQAGHGDGGHGGQEEEGEQCD